jgi:DNA ligase-1
MKLKLHKSKKIFKKTGPTDLALLPGFMPMKGVSIENFDEIVFPVLATPKLDGVRCLTREPIIKDMFDDVKLDVLSYALKPIPNAFIKKTLREYGLRNLDGELIELDANGVVMKYNPIQSGVMTVTGEPNFRFCVFDIIDYAPYWERQECLLEQAKTQGEKWPRIQFIKPVNIMTAEQLAAYEVAMLEAGFEGVCVRSIDGPYKCGRSTKKEGYLYKIKRFLDAEATVIDFTELEHNLNEPTINAHGLQERSDHAANQLPGDTLGALVCSGHNGVKFRIGSGFTAEERYEIWHNKDKYRLKLVKYKYQKHSMKDAPRSPIFLGWRDMIDLGEQ